MFGYGDIILNILIISSIIGAWATVFFRQSLIAAYISTFSLVYMAIYAFKVMEHMEFFAWTYLVLAAMMVARIIILEKLKGSKNDEC